MDCTNRFTQSTLLPCSASYGKVKRMQIAGAICGEMCAHVTGRISNVDAERLFSKNVVAHALAGKAFPLKNVHLRVLMCFACTLW